MYSIIECAQPRTFGRIGIGGRGNDVYTVHYKDLAAVVSQHAAGGVRPDAGERAGP